LLVFDFPVMPVKSVKTPKIGKANIENHLVSCLLLRSEAQLLTPYRKHEMPLQAKALLTFDR
jgi:hypothetical protein